MEAEVEVEVLGVEDDLWRVCRWCLNGFLGGVSLWFRAWPRWCLKALSQKLEWEVWMCRVKPWRGVGVNWA